jgi:cyclohexanecarboxylate-CoA ligase
MEFDAVMLLPRRTACIAKGFWHDRTINDGLAACVEKFPDKIALTAVKTESDEITRFTYRELATMADRIAVGLSRLGVSRNDVVACQLPNWWQFTLTYLACSRIGAVMNPLMPIFREHELSLMLKHGEAKVLITPKLFRSFNYEEMAMALQPTLPALQHIVIVGGSNANSFEALLSGPAWEEEPDTEEILSRHRPGPDDITQLLYTSGTTGEPKGVMHSANTTISNIIPYAERMHMGATDVILAASPMAHQTGFLYGMMMPIMLQASAVLQDVWNPKTAVQLINKHGITFTMASTPFLTDLAKAVTESGSSVPTLRIFLCAGTPIPGPLVEQARQAMDAHIVAAWGMTENGAVTLTRLDDDERSFTSDGCPLPGAEVKVVDDDGVTLPPDVPGKLLVRACSNFGGYLKRPHLNATDADGWFDTGDLARIDAAGYIRITGRSKDVIIRGGENIPVAEIETMLYRHPAIAMVAIVAYPDDRLGERACAIVTTKPGQSVDLPSVVDFLKEQKVTLQYIPERLIALDAMPMTPSGKIQKFKLRQMLRDDTI